MTRIIAILSATLMSSTAFAAPLASDFDINDRSDAPLVLAQVEENDMSEGESPQGPIVDEDEEEMMGTTTGPDQIQAGEDELGESPDGSVVDEDELIEEEGSNMTTGPDETQAEDDEIGESPAGPVVEEDDDTQ